MYPQRKNDSLLTLFCKWTFNNHLKTVLTRRNADYVYVGVSSVFDVVFYNFDDLSCPTYNDGLHYNGRTMETRVRNG